jgi:hypothetical protein
MVLVTGAPSTPLVMFSFAAHTLATATDPLRTRRQYSLRPWCWSSRGRRCLHLECANVDATVHHTRKTGIFELARVLVGFDHVTSFIVNADDCIM